VVAEVTSAFILVFGAGLFLNSFVRLTNLPLGFDTRDRLSVSVPLIGPRYEDPQAVVELSRRLLDEMQSIPGVLTATVASSVPLASGPAVDFAPADRPMPAAGEEPRAIVRAVTPEYFRTFAIRQLSGRAFTSSDVEGSPRVAVINETLARRFFADRDPVGRELVLLPGARGPWIRRGRVQILGVVTNTKDVGIHEVDFNNIYLPFPQSPPNAIQVGISAAVPPATLVDSIRQAVVAADSQLAVLGITAMTQRATDALRSNRFNLFLIGTFAGIALLLAAIGIYGVMSYSIQQRTPEFGLRLALGARKRSILALALGQALRLGVAGAVLGLGLALIIARALGNALYLVQGEHEGLIYGVTTTDPLTLICAAAAVTIVAALAGFVPARRAMTVEPAAVLRE
jgi:putative ABC transport system permease protein